MKKNSILGKVLTNLPPNGRTIRWEDRVAAEHRPILEEIKAAWSAGELGASVHRAALAVAKTLNECGVSPVGQDGVRRWLQGN